MLSMMDTTIKHVAWLEAELERMAAELAACQARCERLESNLRDYITEQRFHALDTIEEIYRSDLADALEQMLNGTWEREEHVHVWLAQIGPEKAAEFLQHGDLTAPEGEGDG